jgi:N-acetylglucosaminyldiphosphoundecaprenol N-acetyl-beta-D-mannosaminyltransferase
LLLGIWSITVIKLAAEQARNMKVSDKIHIFNVTIDALSMSQAVARIGEIVARRKLACDYIVTPNVDHLVKLEADPAFARAYHGASLVLTDGKPLLFAARLLGTPLPEIVPGSDLVPAVFDFANQTKQQMTVFLLGAMPGVAVKAADEIHARWGEHVRVVGTLSPDLGFENDPVQCEDIIRRINECKPDLLVLGLGAPKQELWIHAHQERIQAGVAFCVGATIDFLAGVKKRAPAWVQALAMEWAYRTAQEPKRLATRYAYDAWVFPRIVAREAIKRMAGR